MKLPALLTSDLHLTDNPRDEYRWGIWKWLDEQNADGYFKTLVILGDLTDAKDYHSAALVNRMVRALHGASKRYERIIILMGNHDYLKAGSVFFEFLGAMNDRVRFITKPTTVDEDDKGLLAFFLPHSKNPTKDWAEFDFSHYDALFLHQTVTGAIASNGQKMEGESMPPLNAGRVFSGDIHVPQKIGPVEYVGSPYHVHFGDSFEPRCIELDHNGKAHDLHFETIRRVAVRVKNLRELRALEWGEGDQAKIKLVLSQADAHAWAKLKREIRDWLLKQGVTVEGIELELERTRRRLLEPGQPSPRSGPLSDPDAILAFVEAEDLGAEAYDVAMEILK